MDLTNYKVSIREAVTIEVEMYDTRISPKESFEIINQAKENHFKEESEKWHLSKTQTNGYVTTAFFIKHEITVSYGSKEIQTNKQQNPRQKRDRVRI